MKKVYLLSALGGLLLASCANDDLVSKPAGPDTNATAGAISFNMKVGNMSRATNLESVVDNFGVWAIKTKSTDDITTLDLGLNGTLHEQVVMNDYEVDFTTTPNYGSFWNYEGVNGQFLKYWDGSYDNTYFFAYAASNNKRDAGDKVVFNNEASGGPTLTFANLKMSKSAADLCLYADVRVEDNDDFISGSTNDPNKVPLTFHRMQGEVRIAIWESIPGYSVEMVNVEYADNTTAGVGAFPAKYDFSTTPMFSQGEILSEAATATAQFNMAAAGKDKPARTPVFTDGKMSDALALNFDIPAAGQNVGTSRADASKSETVYYVLPNNGTVFTNTNMATGQTYAANSGLQFVMNYKLKAEDTNEVIEVKGARVYVPATYTAWEPNTVYTYYFQITKNSSGTTTTTKPVNGVDEITPALYPIIFDQITIAEDDKDENDFVVNQNITLTPSVVVLAPGEAQNFTMALAYDTANNADQTVNYQIAGSTDVTFDAAATTTTTATKNVAIKTGAADAVVTLTATHYGLSATSTIVIATWTDFDATATINKSDTMSLTAPINVTGAPAIVWTSSDEAVATVANGVINAVAPGTATITATLGNKNCSCVVTVTDN